MNDFPPLKPLHSDNTLIQSKLNLFRRLTTDELILSLTPGLPGALKVRPNGVVMDGHHRIKILRERDIEVDALPREIFANNEGEL